MQATCITHTNLKLNEIYEGAPCLFFIYLTFILLFNFFSLSATPSSISLFLFASKFFHISIFLASLWSLCGDQSYHFCVALPSFKIENIHSSYNSNKSSPIPTHSSPCCAQLTQLQFLIEVLTHVWYLLIADLFHSPPTIEFWHIAQKYKFTYVNLIEFRMYVRILSHPKIGQI